MAENDTNGPEEYLRVCRAVYDYGAQDGSALSFKTGDIIEVLSMQDSGWWDGLLRGERGWFPSNYVEVVPDDEAETLFSDSEVDSAAPSSLTHSNHGSEVDMGSAMMGSLQENVNWLNSELAGSSSNITSSTESTLDSASTQVHDFWIPEVTNDGQVFILCFISDMLIDPNRHRYSMSIRRQASGPEIYQQKRALKRQKT